MNIVILVFFIGLSVASLVPIHVHQDGDSLFVETTNYRVVLDTNQFGFSVQNAQQKTILQTGKQALRIGQFVGFYVPIYLGYLFQVGVNSYFQEAKHTLSWKQMENSVVITIDSSSSVFVKNHTITVKLDQFNEKYFTISADFNSNTVSLKPTYLTFPQVSFNFALRDEKVFGFGQRWNEVNQRGVKLQNWLEEGSWSFFNVTDLPAIDGKTATYMPIPFWITNRGYAMELDTHYRTEIDIGHSDPNTLSFKVETNTLEVVIYLGETPAENLALFTERRGKSLIPPPFVFAPWKQLMFKGNNCTVVGCAQKMIDHDIPFSLQQGYVHFFPAGAQVGQEAALKKENEQLHAMGIKSTCYFNPFVSTSYSPVFEMLTQKNYLTTDLEGKPFVFRYMNFHSAQIDFTNPDAIAWYQSQIDGAIQMQYDGFMYDFAEYTPINSKFHDGRFGLEMHNPYTILYEKAAYDYFVKNSTSIYAPPYVYFHRSGYTQSGKYAWAHWTGDAGCDWGEASGLPAQIKACLSSGLSGVAYCGSDIGGYVCQARAPLSVELLARWVEYGAFSGIMRDETDGGDCKNRTQIFTTPEITRVYRKYSKLRTALFPYIYTAAHELPLPITRHHSLHFPQDEKAMDQKYQYMFGSQLLVAPVIYDNSRMQDVYLPENEYWYDIMSNATYDESDGRFRLGYSTVFRGGQTIRVAAPLDVCPLFVRAGSIIPLLDPSVFTVNSATRKDIITMFDKQHLLHLWIFPYQRGASGKIYDGTTIDVHASSPSVQILTIQNDALNRSYIIQMVSNTKPVTVSTKESNLVYVDNWEVLVGDSSPEGWTYVNGIVWLRLAHAIATLIY